MPLILTPFTESDISTFTRVENAAFTNNAVFQYMWPNGKTQADYDFMDSRNLKALRNESNTYFLNVTDTETKTIIAIAQWCYIPERSSEDLKKVELPETWPPSANSGIKVQAFTKFLNMRDEIMGNKPFWMLLILGTHPEHQRRGAGKLLLEWGMERAEKEGLECYLEASPAGRPMYGSFGWEMVRQMDHDYTQWKKEDNGGTEKDGRVLYTGTAMVWKPSGKNVTL